MRIEDFEQQAKNAFESYKPIEDHDLIWNNIEPHLHKRRKRRFLFWLFWALAGLGAAWWLLTSSPTTPNQHLISEKSGKNTNANHREGAQSAVAIKDQIKEDKGGDNPEKLTTGATNILARTNDVASKLQQKTGATSPVKVAKLRENELVFTQKDENTVANEETTTSLNHQQEGAISAQHTPVISPEIIPVPSVSQGAIEPPSITQNDHQILQPFLPEIKTETDTLKPVLAQSNTTLNISPETKVTDQRKKTSKKKPVTKKHKTPKGHSIGIAGGMLVPIKTLRLNDASASEDELLIVNRRATEKSLEAFSVALQYQWTARNGWFVRSGLDYNQLNEQFSIKFKKEETTVLTGIVSITVDKQGNVVNQVNGPKSVTTIREYENVSYNNFQFVNFPIGFGHRNSFKRCDIEWALGLDVNLMTQFEGTLMAINGYPNSYFSPSIFKQRYGFGAWANMGYSRRISGHLRWLLRANFSAPLQPVTTATYGVTQRYFLPGLQTGMVYDFTKNKVKKDKKKR